MQVMESEEEAFCCLFFEVLRVFVEGVTRVKKSAIFLECGKSGGKWRRTKTTKASVLYRRGNKMIVVIVARLNRRIMKIAEKELMTFEIVLKKLSYQQVRITLAKARLNCLKIQVGLSQEMGERKLDVLVIDDV
jgi:hypothetical protein